MAQKSDALTAEQTKDIDRLLGDQHERLEVRRPHEPVWGRINALIYPDGTPVAENQASLDGQTTRSEIYDNTAEDAADSASAALHAMTTNPATRWLEMGLFNERYARDTYAGAWLWDLTTRMLRSFRHPTSRFNLAVDEDNKQYVALGNGLLHCEDRPGKLPLWRGCDVTRSTWAENADGEVDLVGREFELTARAAIGHFGVENLPSQIRELADKENRSSKYKRIRFLHVNEPRSEADLRAGRRGAAYRSVYLCLDHPWIVRDGGGPGLEYVASRWSRRANEIYGRGCGHKALGDVDILQRMNRTTLLAGERTIDPPIIAPDDEEMGPISLKGRAVTRVRPDLLANGAHPRAFLTNTRVDIGLELIADRRELVRRSFLKQLLELVRDPKYTATHVLSIEAEQKRGLAPLLGRMEVERLGPIVARQFQLLMRMPGVIDPAPEELRGMPLQPTFDSPDARAMRLGTARAIAQGFELVAPFIRDTKDDALWDNFDLDESLRAQVEGLGMPSANLRPIDVRDRMRVQRQAVEEAREQRESLKDFTTGMKNAAPMAAVVAGLMKDGGAAPAAAPEAVAA